MFMHIDTHSPPALPPSPPSQYNETDADAGKLDPQRRGQTGNWEGVSAGGRLGGLGLPGFSHLIAISPAPPGA